MTSSSPVAPNGMALAVGARIGPYEVLGRVGAGGMGEVYRARDARLGRDVALKVMPASVRSDPDRQRRFELEARAVASLSHPNVLAVFDVGEHDGAPYIVAELLDGRTVREHCGDGTALPMRTAIDWAAQIARGLAAAHEKGIVHRDLKPENLFVTRDGRVKILDFGLAKVGLAEAATGEGTVTAAPETRSGAVLGTAGYMAPEQVQGGIADHRSDLFGFGAVLYEMLAGDRAFHGRTSFEKAVAIVKDVPRPLPRFVPPEVARVVMRCLEKEPGRRYQSALDLGVDLDALAAAPARFEAVEPAGARPAYVRWAARGTLSLAVLVAAGAIGFHLARRSPPLGAAVSSPPVAAAGLVTNVGRVLQLTGYPGPELFPALSPDGTWFAYARRSASGWDIFRQRVGGENPQNLTLDSPGDDTHPAISGDGEYIAFRSERDGGGVFVMGATGESVRRVSDFGYHPAWSPDGSELVVANWYFEGPKRLATQSLWEIRIESGARRRFYPLDSKTDPDGYGLPAWSPHGRRIAWFGGWEASLYSAAVDGSDVARVTRGRFDMNPVWHPDGRSLWYTSLDEGTRGIWRVGVDEASGRAVSRPGLVIPGVGKWMHVGAVSRDGRRLVFTAGSLRWNIARIRFDPVRETTVGSPIPLALGTSPVMRNDQVAFANSGGILVMKSDGGEQRKLTEGAHFEREPVFSHDGKEIFFTSERNTPMQIWAVRPDGAGLRQVTSLKARAQHPVPSPDGARLAVRTFDDGAQILALAPGTPLLDTLPPPAGPGTGFDPRSWSRDGRLLAGTIDHDDGGQRGVAIWSLAERRYSLPSRTGGSPIWLRDSRRLLYRDQEHIALLDTASGRSHQILAVAPDGVERHFSLSDDERWIYLALEVHDADVWMAELE